MRFQFLVGTDSGECVKKETANDNHRHQKTKQIAIHTRNREDTGKRVKLLLQTHKNDRNH